MKHGASRWQQPLMLTCNVAAAEARTDALRIAAQVAEAPQAPPQAHQALTPRKEYPAPSPRQSPARRTRCLQIIACKSGGWKIDAAEGPLVGGRLAMAPAVRDLGM